MSSGKRKIQLTLNTRSIDAAIKEVKGRKLYIERRTKTACERIAERAVDLCRANLLAETMQQSGDLYDKISADVVYDGDKKNGKFRVILKADSEHALYVEFGSGIEGKKSPHPQAGKWGGKKYRDTGWWTAADGKDMAQMYGWLPFELPDGTVIYYTEGQPARPFMYKTRQQLQEEIPKILREVFKT